MIDKLRLKDRVQSCNINFLFGSGMSAPYLSPLGNLETLLTALDKDNSLEKDKKELIQVSIYKKFFDDVIEKNIDIIQNKNDTRLLTKLKDVQWSSVNKRLTLRDFNYQWIEFGRNPRQKVLKSYQKFFSNINQLMLNRKTSLLSKQVNIFTTNIDVYLEKALEEKGFEFNDGFSGRFGLKYDLSNFKKSMYQSSLHYENSFEIPVFNVLKLHGSLNWKIENDKTTEISGDMSLSQVYRVQEKKRDFIKVGNQDTLSTLIEKVTSNPNYQEVKEFREAYEKLVIINPTKEKFKETLMNQTHYDLLRIYANELEKENTLLFVMGFSFADEHIRELTVRVANANPTLQVIIFAYTKDAKKDIEENIIMSKIMNNNILIESPSPSPSEDCDYVYNFDTINRKIFKNQILDKIGVSDE